MLTIVLGRDQLTPREPNYSKKKVSSVASAKVLSLDIQYVQRFPLPQYAYKKYKRHTDTLPPPIKAILLFCSLFNFCASLGCASRARVLPSRVIEILPLSVNGFASALYLSQCLAGAYLQGSLSHYALYPAATYPEDVYKHLAKQG